MANIIRNFFAVIVGCFLGGLVNMGIVMLGPMVIPLPEGVDMTNMETLAENIAKLEPVNFIAPFLAHALGTLVGAFVTAKVAASRKMVLAVAIGVFFLIGGITMVAGYGGPIWFAVLDLVVAYIPMGWLGGKLAGATKLDTTK